MDPRSHQRDDVALATRTLTKVRQPCQTQSRQSKGSTRPPPCSWSRVARTQTTLLLMRGVRLDPRPLPRLTPPLAPCERAFRLLEATLTDLAPFKEANLIHRAEGANRLMHTDMRRTPVGMVRSTPLPHSVLLSFAAVCLASQSVLSTHRKVKDTRTLVRRGEKASSKASDPFDYQTRSSEMHVRCASQPRPRTLARRDACSARAPLLAAAHAATAPSAPSTPAKRSLAKRCEVSSDNIVPRGGRRSTRGSAKADEATLVAVAETLEILISMLEQTASEHASCATLPAVIYSH